MSRFFVFALSCLFALSVLSCKCGTFTQSEPEVTTSMEQSWEDITAAAEEAVVLIQIYQMTPIPIAMSYGSGFLVSPDGLIITASHVLVPAKLVHGAEVWVKLKDGTSYPVSLMIMPVDYDIAIIKIDGKNLPYLDIADNYDIRKGEAVLSIGHAKGFLWSVTNGIVANPTIKMGKVKVELMQVTAPMNPGCSGGPVLNKHGQVIGLNQGIMPDMWGTYLAVPSSQILEVLGGMVPYHIDTDSEPASEEEPQTDSS